MGCCRSRVLACNVRVGRFMTPYQVEAILFMVCFIVSLACLWVAGKWVSATIILRGLERQLREHGIERLSDDDRI